MNNHLNNTSSNQDTPDYPNKKSRNIAYLVENIILEVNPFDSMWDIDSLCTLLMNKKEYLLPLTNKEIITISSDQIINPLFRDKASLQYADNETRLHDMKRSYDTLKEYLDNQGIELGRSSLDTKDTIFSCLFFMKLLDSHTTGMMSDKLMQKRGDVELLFMKEMNCQESLGKELKKIYNLRTLSRGGEVKIPLMKVISPVIYARWQNRLGKEYFEKFMSGIFFPEIIAPYIVDEGLKYTRPSIGYFEDYKDTNNSAIAIRMA